MTGKVGATDFLSGLLDRAFERTPVLERRRPSLFEPMADEMPRGAIAAVNPVRMPDEGVESFEIRDAPAMPPESRVRRTTSQPRFAEKESRIAEEPRRPVARSVSENREPDRRSHESAAPRMEQQGSKEVKRDEPSAPPKQESRKETARAAEVAVQAVEPQSHAPARPELEPKIASKASLPDPLAPVTERVVSAEAPSVLAAEVRNTEVNRARTLVQPAILPALRPSLPQRRPQAVTLRRESPAPPTIHVTIGRVEIRATSSPTAPVRAARTSEPKLSLQDYLKSRGGAGK